MTPRFPIRKRIIRKGVKIFILCTILGLVGVHFLNENTLKGITIDTIKAPFFLLVIMLTACDYMLGGGRIAYTTWAVGKKIRYINAIRADLSNTFLASVTPMQTGGGPAQLYILSQAGLKLGEAMTVSLVNFISTMFFIFSVAGMLIFSGQGPIDSGLLSGLFKFGYLFACFLITLIALIKWRPGIAFFFIRFFKKLSHVLFPKFENDIEKLFTGLIDHLRIFWVNIVYLAKNKKLVLLGGLAITVVLFLNKYTMAYCVIRGLGIDIAYKEILFAMVILNSLLYFSPSPGASGIAEIAAASIMGTLIPSSYLIGFIVIWRVFSSYLGVSLGAIVIYKAFSSTIDSVWDSEGVASDFISN